MSEYPELSPRKRELSAVSLEVVQQQVGHLRADLAHDRVDAVEKIGEEGASAALSDRLNRVYGAPMRKDFSKIRRGPGSCKAEDGDIRCCVEEFLSVLFAEEAVGTQPAASRELS